MNMKKLNLFYLLIFFCLSNTAKSEIFFDTDPFGALLITWTHPECATPKSSWDNKPYKFKYRKASSAFWEDPIYADGNSAVGIPASLLTHGEVYKFEVKYYCSGRINIVKTLAVLFHRYSVVTVPTGDLSNHVRIGSHSYNKCMYPYTTTGINGLKIHNWGCWSDPSMAFQLIPTGTVPDQFRLYAEATGSCLKPNSSADYATMTAGDCGSSTTIFQVTDMGSNTFRLRNVAYDKCLFGSPNDGGLVMQHGCWSHPDFLFEFQGY